METHLERGKNAHETRRFDEAAQNYRAALAHAPDHPEALHLLGVLQFQRGDAAEADCAAPAGSIHSPRSGSRAASPCRSSGP
ncbi:tetratricopeptide repeat protein [Burkholderia sp. Ac-20379]|nr:tetratricopeptide repeat protein [Burkholderia sp. Ac-20379]MBN3727246.1 tetratricopeptide repeat protein [Burkholderia sp. Ac-20379]